MKKSSVFGYIVAFLLAGGVIATLLTVLMVDLEPSKDVEGPPNPPTEPPTDPPTEPPTDPPTEPPTDPPTEPPEPTEPPQPVEGNFTYTEVPGFGYLKAKKSVQGPAIFAGIPYAARPVGDGRWANPQPAPPLPQNGQYYDATYPRPACPQLCTLPSPEYACPKEMDEDCLHVVVYVPSKLTKRVDTTEGYYYMLVDDVTSADLPVMVFFHGGAFTTGGNGVTLYDGRFIAEKGGVIVVTVNYRVGPFGFLYQNSGDANAALGNFAMYDQIKSLKWVRDHIRYFGGNAESVTLFGQSAGAQSVAVHLVNDVSGPLFHRAILQSNPFGLNFKNMEEAQTLGNNFVNFMKSEGEDCEPNDMACLRKIPAENILTHLKNFPIVSQVNTDSFTQLFEPWAPVIDDVLLSQHPFYLFKEGSVQNKPMIHGFTTDEGIYFVAQALTEPLKSNRLYSLFIRALFGSNATIVEEQYPADCEIEDPDCDNRESLDDWVTDQLFTCPTRRVFNTEARLQEENLQVWLYTFDQLWSFPEFWENYTVCYNLTCHAAELPYLFDADKLTDFRFTEEEQKLAEKFIFYWTNFAKYGNPNELPQTARFRPRPSKLMNGEKSREVSPTVAYWPKMYEFDDMAQASGSDDDYNTLLITAASNGGERVIVNFQKRVCDFWDENDFYLDDSLKLRDDQNKKLLHDIKVLP